MKNLHPYEILVAALVLFVAAAFLFAGCGCGGKEENKTPGLLDKTKMKKEKAGKEAETEEAAPTIAPAAAPKAPEPKMEITKVGESKNQEPYSYDPINKIDPFAQYEPNVELPTGPAGKDENTLTKYEIRYFRLVGIIADESQPRAIFEDPRQHAYVVTVGTPIGRNLGVIEQILPDSVVVSEQRFVPGGPNELETVQLVIKLHPDREKESQGGGG